MAYQIIERPVTFDEVVGNEHIVQSLESLLQQKQHPHAFMFHGPSGVGKTTLCRVCAKFIGAEDVDIREYNIGNTRGIDTAREIEIDMQYPPLGPAKVYILDEAHRATTGFLEALLTPIEEPPPYVYFFLATTEKQKIPHTLKRRFTTYEVKPVDDDDMFDYMVSVAKKYKTKPEPDALDTIIEIAEGSIGIALNLLEKIAFATPKDQMKLLSERTVESKEVRDLCQSILYNKGWTSVLKAFNALEEEPEAIRAVVLAYMGAVLKSPKSEKLHYTAANTIDKLCSPWGYNPKAQLLTVLYSLTLE